MDTKGYANLDLKKWYNDNHVRNFIIKTFDGNGYPDTNSLDIDKIGSGSYGDAYLYNVSGNGLVLKVSRGVLGLRGAKTEIGVLRKLTAKVLDNEAKDYTAWCVDSWENDGKIYIVMQHAMGDMHHFDYKACNRGIDANIILKQMLISIYMFHKTTGLVHNDVKLDNFLYFKATSAAAEINGIHIQRSGLEIVLYDPGLAINPGTLGRMDKTEAPKPLYFHNDYQRLFRAIEYTFGLMLPNYLGDHIISNYLLNATIAGMAMTKLFNKNLNSAQCLKYCCDLVDNYTIKKSEPMDIDTGELSEDTLYFLVPGNKKYNLNDHWARAGFMDLDEEGRKRILKKMKSQKSTDSDLDSSP